MANRLRRKILIAFGAFVVCLGCLIWILGIRSGREQASRITPPAVATPAGSPAPSQQPADSSATMESEAAPVPTAANTEINPTPTPSSTPTPAVSTAAPFGSHTLLVPVAGVRLEHLKDTFQEARTEGRVHDAIDIPAARGTPVLAAADGRIIKLFNSDKGGITIYQMSADEKLVYYYAHLERYAEGLAEGRLARRGEVIAYVGDTGNAGPGNYHLHFSVTVIADPKRYWAGTNINPYPMLRGAQ